MHVHLHAGHFKTGTTAFQQLLQHHAPQLPQRSILVPSMPHGNHGYHLRCDASGVMGTALAAELADAKTQGFATCILSAEVVSHFDDPEFAALGRLLAPYPTTVVLVLRHWYSFLPSRWAQNVRRCDAMRLDEYIARIADDGMRHPDADFALIVERARRVFDDVRVLPYGSDVAARSILASAGLGADAVAKMIAATPPANVSLDPVLTEIVRLANALVCAHLGLPADQKNAQVFRRADPITVLNLDSWLPGWLQQRPDVHDALKEVVSEHSCEVDLAVLQPRVARWWERLQRFADGRSVDWQLPEDFCAVAPTRVTASRAGTDDISPSLRAELLAGALRFLRHK